MDRKLVAIAVGAVVIGAVVGTLAGGSLLTPTQKDNFTLVEQPPGSGTCVYDLKQDGYVTRGNNLKFEFHNRCNSEVTLAVGNVRTAPNTASTNCTNATDNAAWTFKQADADEAKRKVTVPPGKKGGFVLHGATNPGSYYFSVCIGNEVKDPRLVIE